MNHRNLLLILLVSFAQAPLCAMSNDREFAFWDNVEQARAGFVLGYLTGLVPVAGQAVFPLLIGFATESPYCNASLVAGAALVGHAAGVATLATAACCCCRLTRRLGVAATSMAGQALDNRIDRNPGIAERLHRLEEHAGLRPRIQGLEDEQAQVRVVARDLEEEYAQ